MSFISYIRLIKEKGKKYSKVLTISEVFHIIVEHRFPQSILITGTDRVGVVVRVVLACPRTQERPRSRGVQ